MFYPCTEKTSRVILYFHANAEDVGLASEFLRPIKETLYVRRRVFEINFPKAHILAVEYPGYGEYDGVPNEE